MLVPHQLFRQLQPHCQKLMPTKATTLFLLWVQLKLKSIYQHLNVCLGNFFDW